MASIVRRRIKFSGICLFLAYVSVLIYLLFFAESYGRGGDGAFYDYNIQPFREIRRYLDYWEILGVRTVFLNLAGNIIGFVPFGALLPIFTRSVRRLWKVTLLSLEISAIIEMSQLVFRVGCFDVDDMILNTLGGFLGYLLFRAASNCYRRIETRRFGHSRNQI